MRPEGEVIARAGHPRALGRDRELDELDAAVGDAGGLETIAISHPHYYTSMVEWADRFDARILLHEDDRDWVGFLAHLVSAGREFDPDFAPRTAALGPTSGQTIDSSLIEAAKKEGHRIAPMRD